MVVIPTTDQRVSVYTAISLRKASLKPYRIGIISKSNSLLANNFNSLWWSALSGDAPSWWLMLHSDVSVDGIGWIDKMIEIAESRNLDILSGIIPFRSDSGLTSTAIDCDKWAPRRLTMTEVMDCPPTFDNGYAAEKFGHPLLFNTGLMLVRWEGDWRHDVTFTINDKVEGGKAMVEPEDWGFSRWCRARDIRVAVTREVKIIHHDGSRQYSNENAWGTERVDPKWPS